MNPKHKQAFGELRQWCEKWDADISTTYNDTDIEVQIRNNNGTSMYKTFSYYIDKDTFNFMEQEDDTEK